MEKEPTMELIPIGETKLKITLDEREMAEYPLRRRDSNRAVLLRLLREIKDRCGFDTSGSRVFVQMYPGRRGGCELYVTKLCARESPWSEGGGRGKGGSLYLANALAEEYEQAPDKLWETNFFGKSLKDLIQEGINGKLHQMPPDAQEKVQSALTKMLNEGEGGMI